MCTSKVLGTRATHGTLLVSHPLWQLVTCNNYLKTMIPDMVMIVTLWICVGHVWADLHKGQHHPQLASQHQWFFWPSLVPIEYSLLYLCWPLTSMKVIIILSLHQQFLGPCLVAIRHCSTFLTPNLSLHLTSPHHPYWVFKFGDNQGKNEGVVQPQIHTHTHKHNYIWWIIGRLYYSIAFHYETILAFFLSELMTHTHTYIKFLKIS